MNFQIRQRIIDEANYILLNNTTLRKCAEQYNVSKSTVHNDVSHKLKRIDKNLYILVKEHLNDNFNEKHIRGGTSTRQKYIDKKADKVATNNDEV